MTRLLDRCEGFHWIDSFEGRASRMKGYGPARGGQVGSSVMTSPRHSKVMSTTSFARIHPTPLPIIADLRGGYYTVPRGEEFPDHGVML